MPQQLHAGIINFEDGTEASISQMAKDITTFLAWASEPTQDERHRIGLKVIFVSLLMWIPFIYYKRLTWMPVKTRRIQFIYDKSLNKKSSGSQSSKPTLY
jgi:ubiquinol-cytochrome c reductase cytochrome c1 subunit